MNKNQVDKEPIKNVLVFTAHPDDHICAAGTLMLLKDKGFKIHEIVATGGEKGVWWESDEQKKENFDQSSLVTERHSELVTASKLIGIEKTTWLGLPDSEIERSFSVIKKISGLIRQERPAVVLAMNVNDYHSDHREFSKIVVEGAERAAWSYQPEIGKPFKVPILLLMEGFYFGEPNLVVDITNYKQKKDKILDIYKSQIDKRERKLLDAMDSYRSFFRRNAKVEAAESFELTREFPIDLNAAMNIFS